MTLRFLFGQLSEGEEKIQDRRISFKVTSQSAPEKTLESVSAESVHVLGPSQTPPHWPALVSLLESLLSLEENLPLNFPDAVTLDILDCTAPSLPGFSLPQALLQFLES